MISKLSSVHVCSLPACLPACLCVCSLCTPYSNVINFVKRSLRATLPRAVDYLFQTFPRTSSQMQILCVRNFCTSASHKCNFVLNQAKGRKSAVFFFPKKDFDNKLLWQCLGTTLLPKLLTLHICFVHSPPPLPGINGQRPANTQALASSNFQFLRRVQN